MSPASLDSMNLGTSTCLDLKKGRVFSTLVSLNKDLLGPYFLGRVALGGYLVKQKGATCFFISSTYQLHKVSFLFQTKLFSQVSFSVTTTKHYEDRHAMI